MDVFERDGGISTADTVHRREEFRQIVADVQELPETQRTALLLREIDALSYDQIAEAMETTVPSVKSLLVRARVALAEAAEARLLTCDEVRLELGPGGRGHRRSSRAGAPPPQDCDRCRTFRAELRKTNKALAAIYPVGPLLLLKKLWIAKLGFGASAGAGPAPRPPPAAARPPARAWPARARPRRPPAGGITAGGAVSAGISTVASKAAAGMAAAVIVTAGAVEVKHVAQPAGRRRPPRPRVAPSRRSSQPQPAAAGRARQAEEDGRQGTRSRRQAEARARPRWSCRPQRRRCRRPRRSPSPRPSRPPPARAGGGLDGGAAAARGRGPGRHHRPPSSRPTR